MEFNQYKQLVYSINNGAFTRQQLLELTGEVISRVCKMDEPELKAVQHDLSEVFEAFDTALDEVDAREAEFAEPDEMDLARDRRAAEEAI